MRRKVGGPGSDRNWNSKTRGFSQYILSGMHRTPRRRVDVAKIQRGVQEKI
jgi:hypothetical protein